MKSQQNYIEETLEFIRNEGYTISAQEFLKKTAQFLTHLLGVEYVLIDKYSLKTPTITETVVVCNKQNILSNFSCELANTPCDNVINKDICVYPSNIQTLFPKDELLVQMNIESYMAVPLWTCSGEPIGLVAILDNKPIKDVEIIKIILPLIALKVEKLLEKILFENELESEKSLRIESENRYRSLFDASFDAIFISEKGVCIEQNAVAQKMFGYTNAEAIGKMGTEWIVPEDRDIVMKKMLSDYEKPYFVHALRKDKTIFPVEIQAKVIFHRGEKVRFTELRNISSHKKLEITLNKSEEKFKKLANLTFEGIMIHSNGIAIDINQSFEKMFGYNREELIGKDIIKLLFPKEYHQLIFKSITNKYTLPYEIEGIRKDGSIFPIETEAREINSDKSNTQRVAALRDITERKLAEKKLKEATNKIKKSEQKFRELFEKSGDAILIIENGIFIECNNATVKMLNYDTKEEFLNVHPSQLSPKNQPDGLNSNAKANKMIKTALNNGTHRFEWMHTQKNGTNLPVEVLLTAISNEPTNKVIHCVWRDITKRKKSENELNQAFDTIKENEESLNKILETANEGFWTINTERLTTKVNPEMCKILGFEENKIIGKSIFEFVDGKDIKIFKKQLKNRQRGIASTYEIELKNSKGKNIPCLFKTSPLYNKNGERIGSFALVTDISEIKKAYKISEIKNKELIKLSDELSIKNILLLESNNRFKNLFEESPVSIWEQDFSEVIELLNDKKADGINIETYLNGHPDFLKECISKIKILNVNNKTLNLLGVKNKEELITHIRKNNSKKAIEILKNEIVSIALGNKEFKSETEFIHANGAVVTAMVKSTLVDPKGKVIASIINITAIREAEKELLKAKEKAEESDRLKTEFLNNMSHEIRTPMNGILGFSQMLSEPDLEAEKRKSFVNIIKNSGNQLLHIIDDILEISSLGTKQVKIINEEVCINDVFLELFSIFDIKAKESKTPLYIKKELSDRQSTIITDKTKLNKILNNLLENALKFTNNGFVEFGYNLKNNKTQLEIYVKDTGIGIKPEKHQLIFERFAQAEKELTKKVGGLGLGLSIAKENTELLGGEILVKSEMMKGSTFFVTIPYKPVYIDVETEDIGNKYTILIAEDEEVNYMYLETILKDIMKLNCDLIHAKNGIEAIEISKNNATIDLILMDLKMPVLNGFKATKEIRKFRPNLPIIAQTAYSTLDDKEEAILVGCNDFISKPIEKKKLFAMIENYLTNRK